MNLTELAKLANSEAFFAVLFVVGIAYIAMWVKAQLNASKEDSRRREEQLIDIYKEQIDKATVREEQLMEYLDKNNDQLETIATTLKDVQINLTKVEDRMETNFMEVWKEIGKQQIKGGDK